ncbi:hypothetical protein KDA23_07050, partial [Candidatus Saccharibacteria bacterium]|nr:hypothetical protein [Candidatus Saccharibacteria bacterium]
TSFRITLQAPTLTAGYTLTLPTDDGTSGQWLTTDGSGVLSWTSLDLSAVNQDILPSGTVDLGSSGSPWEEIHGTTVFATNLDAPVYIEVQKSLIPYAAGFVDLGSPNNAMKGLYTQKVYLHYTTAYQVILQPPTLTASYTLTLPTDDGDSGQALTTDGAGVLSWSDVVTEAYLGAVGVEVLPDINNMRSLGSTSNYWLYCNVSRLRLNYNTTKHVMLASGNVSANYTLYFPTAVAAGTYDFMYANGNQLGWGQFTSLASDIIPSTTGFDLGSTGSPWDDIWGTNVYAQSTLQVVSGVSAPPQIYLRNTFTTASLQTTISFVPNYDVDTLYQFNVGTHDTSGKFYIQYNTGGSIILDDTGLEVTTGNEVKLHGNTTWYGTLTKDAGATALAWTAVSKSGSNITDIGGLTAIASNLIPSGSQTLGSAGTA